MFNQVKSFCSPYILAAFLISFVAIPSFGQEPTPDEGAPQKQTTGQLLPESKEEVRAWVHQKFGNGEYDQLDRAAANWRTSKEAYPDGNWKLTVFYEGLQQFPEGTEGVEQWVAKAWEWVNQKPKSITARVALGAVLESQAWKKRGDEVHVDPDEGKYRYFQHLLGQAAQVLREAKALEAKCPHWWAAAQSIALGMKLPPEIYDTIYQEAIAFEPEYFLYYKNKAFFLLPRWSGEEGDWEKYSLEVANALEGDRGDLLYARLIWAVSQVEKKALPEPAVSFDKLNKGFAVMDKRYPNNIEVKGTWATLITMTGSPENKEVRKTQVRRLLTEIETIEPAEDAPWRNDAKPLYEWVNKD